MPKHEDKHCPRCQTLFECKVGSINLCQCTTVTLTPEERAYIAKLYDDCLCANCMRALQQASKTQNNEDL
ncbi:hypothetical protein BKI52_15665 [marine bacterium AO1-C]|nr:hypothetical protein BKI52_15665 [marine bacterium AO1-C]